MPQPTSFAEDRMSEWSEWVLDHGLPDLPVEVAVGQAVPVAYWGGPVVGAVLHRWRPAYDDPDDDMVFDEVQHFRRTSQGWEEVGQAGSGGGIDPLLHRGALPAENAFVSGETSTRDSHGSCRSIEGGAGAGTTVQVHDSFGVTTRPLDSPLGVFIAATGDDTGATVVVVDGRGVELVRARFGRRR